MLLSVAALLGLIAPVSAQTPRWIGFQVQGDVAYLLRNAPSEIMRYDIATEQWRTSLPLDEVPTAFVVGTNEIYVASDRKIERFTLQGTNKTHVANTPDTIRGLFLDGNILIANRSNYLDSRFSSYNTTSNALIDTHSNYPHSMFGASHAAPTRRIFGRTSGISPADIGVLTYDATGNFLEQRESPYHGTYPGAERTWTWPNGSKVVDSSGTVYVGIDLTYAATIPDNITDVAFHGTDVPIVLRGSQLIAFSQSLVETGRTTLSQPGKNVTVRGDSIFVFAEGPSSSQPVTIQRVPLSDLSPAEPGTPVSPIGLNYTVTSSAVGDDGILYLLSKVHSSVFRWDVTAQQYLSTIPLPETGDSIVFSRSQNALLVLGANRTIYKIGLATAIPSVAAMVTVPSQANRMIPMGSDLLVVANGSWDLQWIYSPTGTLLNSHFNCCYTLFHFFDAPRNRLFAESSFLTYLGNGQFSGSLLGPYVSDYAPLGISPDGQRILGRNGVLYQASPLQPINYLSNNVLAVEWADATRMLTVRDTVQAVDERTTVQRWSPNLTIDGQVSLLGKHVAFHKSGNRLLVVTSAADRPRINVLDFSLGLLPPATLQAPTLELEAASAIAVGLRWGDVQGETSYELDRRQVGSVDWTRVGTVPQDITQFIDVDHHSGQHLEFRARARNGTVFSPWSNVVAVDLTGASPVVPVDPNTVAFTIDDAMKGRDDRIYILSRAHRSIFVWNALHRRFERSISLRGEPIYMAYSETRDALFTAYADRTIYAISPKAPIPYEFPFASTQDTLCGLIAADDVLVACDLSGAWQSTQTFDLIGRRIDWQEWRHPIAGGVWDAVRRRVYHLRDGTFPNDLLYTPIAADGMVGGAVDSPYHSSEGISHPFRVSPNGAYIVLGSGYVFSAENLNRVGTLSSPMIDGTWLAGELVTLRADGLYWQPSELSAAVRVAVPQGTGQRVFTTNTGTVVTALLRGGTTVLEAYGSNFQPIEPPIFSDGFD